ncbi:pyridine nucleotide-disulfide oxidoreductase dimerization subunit [Arthrobacter crystallopoietes BAB-32]|uniref:Pyridine nucleotide-disulfide oxidoreductase dimerization subunit n=1 Tax=Arthrobacter crystallopoietes BAB-32 TaxID=1246476 RepID=N1V4L1_9MICC|nr:mycothione reductase [Arthrobacter crystallopoietes]EMY35017.1 pyridine nucleotide-disulfide oxidoreductase dimerization subunit [Arthrobacter crystallopoietes BAB-32]
MTFYDLAIIGSGSGNSLITPFWDNRKVAIIDGGTFGGTCLNTGCIPTKMYAYPAQLASAVKEAAGLGVDMALEQVHWPRMRDRIFGRIDAISDGGRRYRDEELDNVSLYAEYARFTGPKTLVTASGATIEAEQIVIAAGSRAVLPDVPGIDLPQVHTSDSVMRLPELPGRVLIVGGGFVAAEFAAVFSSFGSQVIQINRSAPLLKSADALVSERFTAAAASRWDVRLGWTLAAVEEAGGGVKATIRGADGGQETVDADIVLVATGRVTNADTLDIPAAGYDLEADGRIAVDAWQRVQRNGAPVDGVYALGDVSNAYQLKHVANHEARVVAHNLEHPDNLRRSDHRFVPSAVFTQPQIASVGLTEEQARQDAELKGSDVVTAVQEYGTTAYGWAMEDRTGFVKLIADRRSGMLLGAHIMGHEASLLIQPLIQAMSFGLDVPSMARGQYWIHPALMEVVENALLALGIEAPAGAATAS